MKIKDILTDETKWCKHAYFRDSKGNGVSYTHGDIAKCCLVGALYQAYPSNEFGSNTARKDAESKLIDAIIKLNKLGEPIIHRFNDNPLTTFKDVREVIELADV